jgi:hypothetical protein
MSDLSTRSDVGHHHLPPRVRFLYDRAVDRGGRAHRRPGMAERRLHEQEHVVGEMDDRLAMHAQVPQGARGVERPEHEFLLAPAHSHRRAIDHAVASGCGHHGLDQRRLLTGISQQG